MEKPEKSASSFGAGDGFFNPNRSIREGRNNENRANNLLIGNWKH
jgi:hypothetical protein